MVKPNPTRCLSTASTRKLGFLITALHRIQGQYRKASGGNPATISPLHFTNYWYTMNI
jgi:hypothetical protein